ncbi:MAG: NPCBM/NEW2 domain-containing protein [Armatimonadetes bacterium]|nr:NPCBM/NEW2 domain-containing protein [Armatimonadota bacterium]
MLPLLLSTLTSPTDGHWSYLDMADLTKLRQSRGRPRRNASVYGGPIKLGGKTYERGIGTHANSLWIVNTGKNARQFFAEVGVQDGEPADAAVVFKVLADEEPVFVSGAKKTGEPATQIRIPLEGVSRIKLEVQRAPGAAKAAAVAWASAQVEMRESTDEAVAESAYAFPPERTFPPVATKPLSFPLKFVMCADSDGTNARVFDKERIPDVVRFLNGAFRPLAVSFTFDPDDVEVRNDTTLNRDFDAGGQTLDDRNKPPAETGKREHTAARSALAKQWPDKIVIVMRRGSMWEWDAKESRWVDRPSSENYSDGRIVSPALSEDPGMFAHELGHYFGLAHTFGLRPKTIDDVFDLMKDTVRRGTPIDDADRVFDGDGIPDTPPDPGTQALEAMGYELFVPFQGRKLGVSFDDGTKRTYTFAPDVFNTMSYYFDCRIEHPVTKTVSGGFTPGQCLTMRTNAENRKALLADPKAKPKNLALASWPYAADRPMVQIRASDVGRGRSRWIADGQASANLDESPPAFGWDGRTGSSVWIEYRFPRPLSAVGTSVTWVKDLSARTPVGLPENWTMKAWSDAGWQTVASGSPAPDGGPVTQASFANVASKTFRLEAKFRKGERGALAEWSLR